MNFRAFAGIILISVLAHVVGFSQSLASDSGALPSQLRITDFDTIHSSIIAAKVNAEKGEFETTEQYNARKKALNPAIASHSTNNEAFVFLSPATSFAKYDADKQLLTVSIPSYESYIVLPPSGEPLSKATHTPAFVVQPSVIKDNERYAASNVLGGKVVVTRRTRTTKYLAVKNFDKNPSAAKITTEFYVPLSVAEATKNNLAVLYLTKLVAPYADSQTGLLEPTFQNPTELLDVKHYLIGEVTEIWIVDTGTKRILQKIKSVDGIISDPNAIIRGKLISCPKFVVPEADRYLFRIINLKLKIDESGNVISAEASSLSPLKPSLRGAAEATALQCKFQPSTSGGRLVKDDFALTFTINR